VNEPIKYELCRKCGSVIGYAPKLQSVGETIVCGGCGKPHVIDYDTAWDEQADDHDKHFRLEDASWIDDIR
jgi:hypothetical protein